MLKHLIVAILLLGTPVCAQDKEELRYAVIMTRHGVRSPTWTNERLNAYSSAPWPDFGVPPGNLTPHGRALMKMMGEFYRRFLSGKGLKGLSGCVESRRLFTWADKDQRTLETARALADGMLPGCSVPIHSVEGNGPDPVFDLVEAGSVERDPKLAMAAVSGRIGPKLDALVAANRPAFDALDYVLKGNGRAATSLFDEPPALNIEGATVTMSGPLRIASTMTENLLLEYANGMKGVQLGWGRLTPANLLQVMALHTAYADLLRRTPYLARQRGAVLLERIVSSLQQAVRNSPVEGALGPAGGSLLLISGHDTNISNLSGLLNLSWILPGYQRDDVPPGGALMLTLWHSPQTGRYWVRTQFLSQTMDQMHDGAAPTLDNPPAIADLFVPGCSNSAQGYPCTFSSFVETARSATRGSVGQ